MISIGNAVATVVIARWENALGRDTLHQALVNRAVVHGPQPQKMSIS